MIVTLLPDTIESLVFEASPPRTPGLHFSDIRESILDEMDPKRAKAARQRARSEAAQPPNETRREGAEGEHSTQTHNYFQGGFTFEYALERALVARLDGIFRPGEIECDGIICSPDGLTLDCLTLKEYKFTWKSSLGAPEDPKFWGWIIQLKAYCYVLGIRHAELHAYFVNGDYKERKPDYKVWRFEFSDEELAGTWKMLVGHARAKGMLADKLHSPSAQ